MVGVIKWFNKEKGFGFIVRDDGRPDIFVHVTALIDRLREPKEGDRVEFQVGESRGRPCAELVRIVG